MKMRKSTSSKPLKVERRGELVEFLKSLNISFNNLKLLNLALSHSSYSNESSGKRENNERLEFLGDAVLSLVITDYLFISYKNKSEGELSKARSFLISEEFLFKIAREINMGDYLLLGRGEENSSGRNKKAILADAFEALIGALYLDQSFKKVKQFIISLFKESIMSIFETDEFRDYKSLLQEHLQKNYRLSPQYKLLKESGPDHNKTFYVQVLISKSPVAAAKGKSKKEAEIKAAKEAYFNIKDLSKSF